MENAELTALANQMSSVMSQETEINTAIKQFMTDFKTLLEELAYVKADHSGAAVLSDAKAVISAIENSGIVLGTFTVITSMTHCTINNKATTAQQNSAYTATVTEDAGATIDSVTITMGGNDITFTAWNAGTGTIYIPAVTGNIIISCVAVTESAGSSAYIANVLYSNYTAAGKFSTKNVAMDLSRGDYVEATVNCTNVDDSDSGTRIFECGIPGHSGKWSDINAVQVYYRSGKPLIRYRVDGTINGVTYESASNDVWCDKASAFIIRIDYDGVWIDGDLKLSSSAMSQTMDITNWEIGATSSSKNSGAFYANITVYNLAK